MEMMSAAVLLFLIMDPLGNLPVFMSVLRHLEPKRRRFVLLRELLIALLVMMLFLFAGDHLLSFLNVREETVSISGGIILFLIAIRMIFPKPGGVTGLKPGEEPFLVPLAIPLVAGPSVLAALLLLAKQHPGENMTLVLALLLSWGLSVLILLSSEVLNRWLGTKGLDAMERLMGLILVMISTQMFLDGIARYFHLPLPGVNS
ncbi:MAG: YhgN family NAAT transporter [Plesiomonas shigelloides]